MAKRKRTKYVGVFYRESDRIGGKGRERIFYVIFKKDGKTIEEKAGRQFADNMTASKAAAYRASRIEGKRQSKKEIREQARSEKDTYKNRWTLSRLWEAYSANRTPGRSLSTDEGRYRRYLEKPFGNIEPKEIYSLDVDRLRIGLSKKLAPQTIKHVLNLLTWIVNYGVKNNLCEGLRFHVKKPTVNNIKTEFLTTNQMTSLLKAIELETDIQISNIMQLIIFTGMRRGEVLNLQWTDLDFERRFITLKDPKGKQDQIIPMNDNAYEILITHPRESSYVFPGRGGRKRVTVAVAANRIKQAAGLPADFRPLHGLRHHYASTLAASGQVDPYTLQKLLTHKDGRMTQRYIHLRDDTLRKASQVAGDIISGTLIDKPELEVIKGGTK